jgi:hypothetical protein
MKKKERMSFLKFYTEEMREIQKAHENQRKSGLY